MKESKIYELAISAVVVYALMKMEEKVVTLERLTTDRKKALRKESQMAKKEGSV
jgi:hypothetical protein